MRMQWAKNPPERVYGTKHEMKVPSVFFLKSNSDLVAQTVLGPQANSNFESTNNINQYQPMQDHLCIYCKKKWKLSFYMLIFFYCAGREADTINK